MNIAQQTIISKVKTAELFVAWSSKFKKMKKYGRGGTFTSFGKGLPIISVIFTDRFYPFQNVGPLFGGGCHER